MKLIIILVLSSFTLMANSQNDRFDSKVKYEYNGIIGKPYIKKNRKVKFNFFPTSLNLLFSKRWPSISRLQGEI